MLIRYSGQSAAGLWLICLPLFVPVAKIFSLWAKQQTKTFIFCLQEVVNWNCWHDWREDGGAWDRTRWPGHELLLLLLEKIWDWVRGPSSCSRWVFISGLKPCLICQLASVKTPKWQNIIVLAKLNILLVTWSRLQKLAASSVWSKMATSDSSPEILDPPNINTFFCLGIFWLSGGIVVWTELFGVSLHPSSRLTTYPWKNILKISLTLISAGQVVRFHGDHLFCKLYFFFILLRQCYGALPTSPSTGKTSAVCPLQHRDGNSFAYHFLFFPQTF